MKSKILVLFLLNFAIFGQLASQEVSFLSAVLQSPWNSVFWETSHRIPRQDPDFLDAVAIPFAYPGESTLRFNYLPGNSLTQGRLSQSYDTRVDQLLPMPGRYIPPSHPVYGQRSVAYLYRTKNFGLNLNLAIQMAGDKTGMQFMEMGIARARINYRVPHSLLTGKDWKSKARVDVFLELSEMQILDPMIQLSSLNQPVRRTLLKTAENNNRPSFTAKQLYASPGISLSTSSQFVFEGIIRVPMNAREANRTLDELWTPEIQTNLGMKYIIPID